MQQPLRNLKSSIVSVGIASMIYTAGIMRYLSGSRMSLSISVQIDTLFRNFKSCGEPVSTPNATHTHPGLRHQRDVGFRKLALDSHSHLAVFSYHY